MMLSEIVYKGNGQQGDEDPERTGDDESQGDNEKH
jgi:hypothetical protein